MMTGCTCRTTALSPQCTAATKPLAPSRHGWMCARARVPLAPVVTASAAASSRTAPAPTGACALARRHVRFTAQGPVGAGGLGALASLAGVSPAGRGMPSSRLVVGSTSVLVSSGAPLKPEAIPASMPAVAEALLSSPLGSACARCSGSLAEACGDDSSCPTPVSAAVA